MPPSSLALPHMVVRKESSVAKRIPNRLKFAFTSSSAAKIEGTLMCSDEAWDRIFDILMDDIVASKAQEAVTPTSQGESK